MGESFELNIGEFSAQEGEMIMVCGSVGTGKTTLLMGLLGQVEVVGDVVVRGKVSYVPQNAFIINASLKDNVLFGHPYEEERYRECIEAACLVPDIKLLPDGEATEIGEKGNP